MARVVLLFLAFFMAGTLAAQDANSNQQDVPELKAQLLAEHERVQQLLEAVQQLQQQVNQLQNRATRGTLEGSTREGMPARQVAASAHPVEDAASSESNSE